MPNKKITELTAYNTPTVVDLLPIIDMTTDPAVPVTKKITWAYIISVLRAIFIKTKVTVYDANCNIPVTDETVIFDDVVAFTATLPATAVGLKFDIHNINTALVTLVVSDPATESIEGVTSMIVGREDAFTIKCYVANKWVIL